MNNEKVTSMQKIRDEKDLERMTHSTEVHVDPDELPPFAELMSFEEAYERWGSRIFGKGETIEEEDIPAMVEYQGEWMTVEQWEERSRS